MHNHTRVTGQGLSPLKLGHFAAANWKLLMQSQSAAIPDSNPDHK